MLELTRLAGSKLTLNAELIELVEATPDTVILLTTGRRLIVRESVAEVVRLVIDYRRSVNGPLPAVVDRPSESEAIADG